MSWAHVLSTKTDTMTNYLWGRGSGKAQPAKLPGGVSWNVSRPRYSLPPPSGWIREHPGWHMGKVTKVQDPERPSHIHHLHPPQRQTCKGKCSWREGLVISTNDKLESWWLEWQKWLVCLCRENLLLPWTKTMEPLSLITFIESSLLIVLFQSELYKRWMGRKRKLC